MFENIILSEQESNIFEKFVGSERNGLGMQWARNVAERKELSEEEKEFSALVENKILKADRFGSRQAKEELAQIALIVVENDYADYPHEVVNALFDTTSIGEFDTIIQRGRIKNTLKVYETAPRTGNVESNYVDFSEGYTQRTHLQAEIEYKMENLRKQGAVGFAEFVMMLQEQITIAKFKAVFDMVLKLKATPDADGAITTALLDDIQEAVTANCKNGVPVIAGLTSNIQKLSKKYREAYGATLDEATKGDMVRNGVLTMMDGIGFAVCRDALKTADGETILPKNKLIGIGGKIGTFFTAGQVRVYPLEDGNSEAIHYKITGIELGIIVDPELVKDKLVIVNIQ